MRLQEPIALVTIFSNLTDPRVERSKLHSLLDIVIIGLCAAIAGCNSWLQVAEFGKANEKWFRRFLDLAGGVPSHDTFGRVFAALDTGEFSHCLQEWLKGINQAVAGQVVAIDGKTLRNSFDKAAEKSALHLVSAWATQARVLLGQVATDQKSNEITAIPKLLETLDLMGAIVTIDAMGCQKEIAAKIRQRGADYVLALKDNHPTLHEAVSEHFLKLTDGRLKGGLLRRHVTQEKKSGRRETREYYITPAPADLPGREEWIDLRTIGMVIRKREIDGKETVEVSYYLSSLPPKVRQFANAARAHWQIENRLHWVLDVIFAEDKSRIRSGNAAETTALLRRLALSILEQDTSVKTSLKTKRLLAGWDKEFLERILTGFTGSF